MSNLRDVTWQIGYGPQDDRLRDFFIPAMAASIRYDRAAGYFSSTMLAVAAAGVTKLILNGGKMRLLCGADLSENDVTAINEGHATLAAAGRKASDYPACVAGKRLCRKPAEGPGLARWHGAVGNQGRPADRQARPSAAGIEVRQLLPSEGRPVSRTRPAIGSDFRAASTNRRPLWKTTTSRSWFSIRGRARGDIWPRFGHRFDRLWDGKERDWVAMPIPGSR